MIKNKKTCAQTEFVWSNEDGEEYFILYSMDKNEEFIQIGEDKELVSKQEKIPFNLLNEVIIEVNRIRLSFQAKAVSLPSPIIKDHREDIRGGAEKIQKQVDSSMQQFDAKDGEIISLSSVNESNEEDADVMENIGMTIENIANLGEVPETPDEFKNQLEAVKKERMSKSVNVDNSKKIRRRDN